MQKGELIWIDRNTGNSIWNREKEKQSRVRRQHYTQLQAGGEQRSRLWTKVNWDVIPCLMPTSWMFLRAFAPFRSAHWWLWGLVMDRNGQQAWEQLRLPKREEFTITTTNSLMLMVLHTSSVSCSRMNSCLIIPNGKSTTDCMYKISKV